MKNYLKWFKSCLFIGSLLSFAAQAEDIDIFAGTEAIDTTLPNVIFVLDNTSNWSRQSQKWPGGLAQGQSEVRAIGSALANQVGKLNVGVVEFTTQGDANQNGGFVRFHLQALTEDSKDVLFEKLTTIYDNINSPEEKRNSNTEYGNLMYDFYNYLAWREQSSSGGGTPTALADSDAYRDFGGATGESAFRWFRSPLWGADTCSDTYLIFIGNPNSSGPASDDATNSNALAALYAAADADVPNTFAGSVGEGAALPLPEFSTTEVTEPGQNLGNSTQCWKTSEQGLCTADENSAGGKCEGLDDCSCTAVTSSQCTGGKKADRTYRWNVSVGGSIRTIVEATGAADATGGAAFNLDDWTKFLRNYGVPVYAIADHVEEGSSRWLRDRVSVTTYTIDVFNAQQNAETSSLLFSAAEVGGGRYFQAKSESQILAAINAALGDILSVSSSFAAVSLPLSATNRAQVDNQVYIGMFRPAPGKKPRWYGNLKRYQVALFNGVPRLADANLHSAFNPQSGFATECAASFWAGDTDTYWEDLGVQPPPRGNCLDTDVTTSDWSDLPDGPFVEKGGVAQQTRELEDGDARTLYTVADDDSLRELADSDATDMGSATVLDYLRGDAAGADEVAADSGLRPSIHGDVVHSRPLPVRYSADVLKLYYGANDGLFRAVDPADGSESWALIAPEHFDRIQRLYDSSPLVKFTGSAEEAGLTYTAKDYYFDGPTGNVTIYAQDGALELAYIYPTMRRGGRMVYALDVTDPDAAPTLLWRKGCPALDSDTGCADGFDDIGQTWSMPIGGYTEGYVDDNGDAQMVVAFGGGFDDCLNEDAAAYPAACSSAKGKGIYVLDGTTGALLRHLPTDAPVVSDLSPIDIDFDGHLDFAYAADVSGNLYRVNFADLGDANPENSVSALAVDDWTIVKIGSVSSNERRFLNAPVAAAFQGTVFVTVGSGDRERPLETNYPYTAEVQNRFYALVDSPYKTFVADPDADLEADEATTVNLDGGSMLAVTADGQSSLTNKDGWYLDLPDRGEQVVNAAVIGGGKVFFNTFQPGGASNGICERPLGVSTGYAVKLFSPGYTEGDEIVGGGMPIPPVIATVRVPPGLPECDGVDCPVAPDDPCATGECEVKTLCIGCKGFEPVDIVPVAPPIRQRMYFSEDVDRSH